MSGWTSCSELCGSKGVRQRDVWCERVAPSAQTNKVQVVGDDHCSEIAKDRPVKEEACRIVPCDQRVVTIILRLRHNFNSISFSAGALRFGELELLYLFILFLGLWTHFWCY